MSDIDLGSNLEAPIKVQKGRKAVGMPDTIRIILEDNEDIPPTGLFVGLNGTGYLIRAGEEVDVPPGVLEILENAVLSVPLVDPQTRNVIAYRERMKYPFRRVRREDAVEAA